MRIIVVAPGPDFSVQDVFNGWVEALRSAGHDVLPYNLNDRLVFYDRAYMQVGPEEFRKALPPEQVIRTAVDGLYSMLYRAHPDVMLVVMGALVPPELLDLARAYGTKVVVHHTESPYEDRAQIELAAHADLNLLNDPTNIDRFNAIAPSVYMRHAYRPALHKPGRKVKDMASDFGFVATGFHSRIAFLEQMDFTGVDVLLAGNWQALTPESPLRKFVAHDLAESYGNDQAVTVYRSTKVGFNFYRSQPDEPSDGWSMGPREVEMAACGLFFLRQSRPEGDAVLPMLPTFASPDEATEQLHYWLAHPRLRQRAARQAREAIADRTFDNNVVSLMQHLTEG